MALIFGVTIFSTRTFGATTFNSTLFDATTLVSLLPIRYFDAAILAASDFQANLTVTDLISMNTLAGSSRYLRFRTNGAASFRSTDLIGSAAASRLLARRDQASNLVAERLYR